MFEIDENNIPFVRTRHALLVLDLQNDFVSPDAVIPVRNPPNFVENITHLVSKFRGSGNVIWVRSVFEASRPVNSDGNSENVITDAELPAARGRKEEPKAPSRPPEKRLGKIAEANSMPSVDAGTASQVEGEDLISETFLTVEPGVNSHVLSPMSPGSNFCQFAAISFDASRDLVFQKTYYSTFKDGTLVQTLRARFVTELYLCGALTNISIFATAIDAARHGYAITIVDDCVGYRSRARHEEALRKLVELTGCDIISSADLIQEFQEREKAQRAPKQPPRRNPRTKADDLGLENLMGDLNLSPDGLATQRPDPTLTGPAKNVAVVESIGSSESLASAEAVEEELKLPTRSTSTEVKRERVKTKIKSRRRHSRSGPRDSALAKEASSSSTFEKATSPATSSTSTVAPRKLDKELNTLEVPTRATISDSSLESAASVEDPLLKVDDETEAGSRRVVPADLDDEIEQMASLSVKEESAGLCEGDTTIVHDLLDDEVAEEIFERLRDEVRWQKMSHQGGDVPRLIAVQGEIAEDGSVPIYRHPADESPPLFQFSPVVSLIRKRVEENLGHPVNHVLIQFYRDGNDYISEHSDKTLDIVPKTFIANVSLGALRTMVFRTKKQQKTESGPQHSESVQPRQAIRVPLPHNSMCRMGLVTNMRWLHGIRQDKRMASNKSTDELAYSGGRISLTFRMIGTFLNKEQTRIWGQGALGKEKKYARTVINGDNAESEKMIRAFGKENHSSEFDWKEHYGKGFDVLHIENSPKLFLSGDAIADLRVKLLLAEYGVEWSAGALSPPFNWKNGSSSKEAPSIPENLPIKFVDNDLSKSTIVGDLAIMLYLDAVYGQKSSTAKKSQPEIARQFTRFQQSGDLLKKWRTTPFSIKPFRRELELWEVFASEASFIAGEKISLADYAMWPILNEISGEWGDGGGLKNLAVYYRHLKELDTFVKALGAKDETGDRKEEEEKVGPKEETKAITREEAKSELKEVKKAVKREEKKPELKGRKTT